MLGTLLKVLACDRVGRANTHLMGKIFTSDRSHNLLIPAKCHVRSAHDFELCGNVKRGLGWLASLGKQTFRLDFLKTFGLQAGRRSKLSSTRTIISYLADLRVCAKQL